MTSLFIKNIPKISAIIASVCFAHDTSAQSSNKPDQNINVIELRNYVLKPGQQEKFIAYFETNFIASQEALGAYPVARFSIKGEKDHFFWIRAFADMGVRSKFLPAFYYGPVWKQYGKEANNMLANNDNVYLLKPLTFGNGTLQPSSPVDLKQLKPKEGIAVIDFYIANTKLDKLIAAFAKNYVPALKKAGIESYTLWISEMEKNDFPRLPVFHDSNLLVAITYYRSEQEYKRKQKQIEASLSDEIKADLQDIITTKSTLILYPTEKSYAP